MNDPGAESLIAEYDHWQHSVANSVAGSGSPDHDDLVQEGRLALWRSWLKDETSHAYLSTAARRAMISAVTRSYWTGTDGTHGKPRGEPPTVSVEEIDTAVEIIAQSVDLIDGLELAYHRGEIMTAISQLPAAQQRYVFARFWLGMDPRSGTTDELRTITGRQQPHSLWSGPDGARSRLKRELSHLDQS